MTSALHVVRSGTGPVLLLIHGSATDRSTWSIQLASPLRERFSLWAYDRRGTGDSPSGGEPPSIEQHAADAAELARQAGGQVWLAGSSFGAVVALEVMRRHPELVRGAALIEPPLTAGDGAHSAGPGFTLALDELAARQGGEAAAEKFLRTVLGEASFERIPRAFRARSLAMWPQIRADSVALIAYAPRYRELGDVAVPTLLLGGERSAPYFRPTLEALAGALPRARLELVKGAGHMLHAEAPRRFTELMIGLLEGTLFDRGGPLVEPGGGEPPAV
jgi:pimeloyl-ACP methyl ester carboxylesterase